MNIRMYSDRLGRIAAVAAIVAALGISGCDVDEVLEVDDPDRVNPGTLDDPKVLDVVVAGAMGDFTGAYSGSGGDAFLSVTGVMSDELFSSGTFPTRTATDRRNQFQAADGNTSDGAYTGLHQARRALKDAAAKVAEFRNTSDPAYSELKALEGFTYVALGEAFCGVIPVSGLTDGGTFEYGQPKSLTEILNDAVAIFDEAIGAGADALAAVGKGRALLNLGQFAEAASAVSTVPTEYVYHIHHSDNAATNPIFSLQGNGRYSVSDNEGENGLPFRSADDPRAPWWRDPAQPNGFDAAYPLFKTLRYTAFSSPVVLASGVEARLIEAEAALQAGQPQWLEILNELRADVADLMPLHVPGYSVNNPSLPPLADPGSPEERRDLLFSERAFWMVLTGHRLGDLRRLVRQYGMAENEVYPTGAYHKGGSYGSDVVFPLDFDETNNPNFELSACNVKTAS